MSPRSKCLVILAVWIIILAASPAPAQDGGKSRDKNMVIRFYQDHISPADGGRCPMHPSCSEYAARAVKKHGWVVGWIMACDRLVRCGRDEAKLAPSIRINAQSYVFDPVEANDFWWFNSKKEKTPSLDDDTP